MYQSFINKFNTISFRIIMVVCALLPLFFLPNSWGGIGAVKGVLLYIGVFLAFSFWLLAQFVSGSLKVPKHSTFLWIVAWVVLAFVSALLSTNTHLSLWGRGFAIDSFAMVAVLGLFTFLVATFARDQKRLVTLFLASFVGSVATVVLQVILYLCQRVPFVANHLAHVANQGTLVGSWVDFAYMATITFVLSLLMYEVLIPKGFFKKLSLGAMILCTIVLVFLNFKAAWVIAIVSSLLIFVYKSSVERSVAKFFPLQQEEPEVVAETSAFPVLSFVALLIGLFFFLSSNSIGASIARFGGVNFSDIRPSFASTTHVMRATLLHDPVFGIGAGKFGDVWNLYHPLAINQTQFWNTTFDGGFSLLQTFATTNGSLATIALLAVIILSLLHGFRLFNYQFPDRFSRFIAVTALIMFVAFVGLFVFSSPGIVLIVFGFFYLGLLLGVSMMVGRIPVVSLDYLRDPRLSFFTILLLVLATMGGFTAAYFSGNRFASIVAYNRAITATTPQQVETRLNKALSLSPNDIYWKTRAAFFARQFSSAAAAATPDKSVLQETFSQAEQSARSAVAWDPTNASNWLALSQVYQLVATPETTDAYAAANGAAAEAQTRNPFNPLIVLNQAQVALTQKDTSGALKYIAKAIELKPDYLDAFILRAQVRTTGGENGAVVSELNAYIKNAPYDEQGYLLLGQAYTAQKQYQSALDAYNRAHQLVPSDPNAFLAIIDTLTALGQKTQALDALQAFAVAFPNITGIEEKKAQIQGAALPVIAPPADTTSKEKDVKKK